MKIDETTIWLKYEFPNINEYEAALATVDTDLIFSMVAAQELVDSELYIVDGIFYNNMLEPDAFKQYSIDPDTNDYLILINDWVWDPQK